MVAMPVLEVCNIGGSLAWVGTLGKIPMPGVGHSHIFIPIKPFDICKN